MSDGLLLWCVGLEVERLLRVAQDHPSLVGQMVWTGAALSASEHIARFYAELKRRHKATRARALVREELRRFVAWKEDEQTADAPDGLPEGDQAPSMSAWPCALTVKTAYSPPSVR